MKLKDKVAVITGSSSGIGKATALLFSQEGVHVVVHYRNNKRGAQEVVQQIKRRGGDAVAIKANVIDPDQVRELFQQSIDAFGKVDILVNSVGLAKAKPFFEITRDHLLEQFEENLFSTIYCCQEAAKYMKEHGGGKIINISSMHGIEHIGATSILAYTSARAGMNIFTRTLSRVLGPSITVNAVTPGFVRTRYWDGISEKDEQALLADTIIKRWIHPEEIAAACLFLVTNDAVTGEIVVVDGGYQLK